MAFDRCNRCFGEILNGKCSCGLHTTVEVVAYLQQYAEGASCKLSSFDTNDKWIENLSKLMESNPEFDEDRKRAAAEPYEVEPIKFRMETKDEHRNT